MTSQSCCWGSGDAILNYYNGEAIAHFGEWATGQSRLPKCAGRSKGVWVFVGELRRELDVSLGETLHFRQFAPQVAGRPGDDGGTPAPLSLPLFDQAADTPVEPDQLAVRGEYRPRLRSLHAGLDFLEEIREVCRSGRLRLAHATLRRTMTVASRTLLGKRFELVTQRFGDVIARVANSSLEPGH
jgi:hypothetical protein